jgi:hypothetical protein
MLSLWRLRWGPMPRTADGYAAAKTIAEEKLLAVKTLVANDSNGIRLVTGK